MRQSAESTFPNGDPPPREIISVEGIKDGQPPDPLRKVAPRFTFTWEPKTGGLLGQSDDTPPSWLHESMSVRPSPDFDASERRIVAVVEPIYSISYIENDMFGRVIVIRGGPWRSRAGVQPKTTTDDLGGDIVGRADVGHRQGCSWSFGRLSSTLDTWLPDVGSSMFYWCRERGSILLTPIAVPPRRTPDREHEIYLNLVIGSQASSLAAEISITRSVLDSECYSNSSPGTRASVSVRSS